VFKTEWALSKLGFRAKVALALVLAAALLALVAFHFFGQKEQGPIAIGAICPLIADKNSNGIHAAFGVHIAKEAINNGGGVLGRSLDLVILNGNGDPKRALELYEELKGRNVVAIIGPPSRDVAELLAGAAEIDGVPFLVPGVPAHSAAAREGHFMSNVVEDVLNKYYYVHFGHKPPPTALAACECMCLLADAINKTKRTTSNALISVIREIDQKTAPDLRESGT